MGTNVSVDGPDYSRPRPTQNDWWLKSILHLSTDNSHQSLHTSPDGANVSGNLRDMVHQPDTDRSVGGTGSLTKDRLDVSLDNSYQSSVTSRIGANVSGKDGDMVHHPNTDRSVGGTESLMKDRLDVSLGNSYQSSVTSHIGANVSGEDGDMVHQPDTDRSVGGTESLMKDRIDVSLDNSYQSSVTSHIGANVSRGNADPSLPQNTDDSVGCPGFLQISGSDDSPDNSYQSSVTSQTGAIDPGKKDVKKPWNTDNSIGVIRFTHTKPSDVVDITVDDTDQEDCAGSPISESEQPLFVRNMDPVPRWTGFTPMKPSDVVFMNIDYEGRPDTEQSPPTSDSGIHSYEDICPSLSTDCSNSDVNPGPEKVQSGDGSLALGRVIPVRLVDPYCSRTVVSGLASDIPDYASDATIDGYRSDVADLADFSEDDDDYTTRDSAATYETNRPVVMQEWVPQGALYTFAPHPYGYDISAERIYRLMQGDCAAELAYHYAIEFKIPPVPVRELPAMLWEPGRRKEASEMMTAASKLDDFPLLDSDYPDDLKAMIFRMRWKILFKQERAILLDTGWSIRSEDNCDPLDEDRIRGRLGVLYRTV